jgi:hypothetical protein
MSSAPAIAKRMLEPVAVSCRGRGKRSIMVNGFETELNIPYLCNRSTKRMTAR